VQAADRPAALSARWIVAPVAHPMHGARQWCRADLLGLANAIFQRGGSFRLIPDE
jgi:hypothetical protein